MLYDYIILNVHYRLCFLVQLLRQTGGEVLELQGLHEELPITTITTTTITTTTTNDNNSSSSSSSSKW